MQTSPSLHPFPYDPFQQQAIEAIERDTSVFVSAPTGSGKTVLADYVIERTLSRQLRVIYTAPIKALSNQKFRDFSARHPDQVGIMTGDVTINRRAPLIIMTTEIYRNTLLEDIDRLSGYAWIIFDEVHYLDDPERGTVWEEAILFTPPHINLLCLSATIPNVEELAQWIRTVHGRPVEVITQPQRSVPLHLVFQCQNTLYTSTQELKNHGFQGGEEWRPLHRRHVRVPGRQFRVNRLRTLIDHLQDQDRLPCIFFTFGRRRTEDVALELSGFSLVSDREREGLRRIYDGLCARFQLTDDPTAHALSRLVNRGVAYHHAGMLPTVKEVVERLFTTRLIKLIVTTETFALGVNMPARSVILDTLKKRIGGGYILLRRREFLQMSGRAGRRGMDSAGFVYLRVNPNHVTFPDVQQLLERPPEPVHSRFNMSYATLLNLYRTHGPTLVDMFPKTLYHFQTSGPRRQAGLELMQRKLQLLASLGYVAPALDVDPTGRRSAQRPDGEATGGGVAPSALTSKGDFASWLYGYELLLTELYVAGELRPLDPIALAVLLVALVYEARPGRLPPKLHRLGKRLLALCREPLAHIQSEERRFGISPHTKAPVFHLSEAMEAWMHRTPFHQVARISRTDDGELVRYFRMTVQLLRQLAESPAGDPHLGTTARRALEKINRDVIDAEAQLRMG